VCGVAGGLDDVEEDGELSTNAESASKAEKERAHESKTCYERSTAHCKTGCYARIGLWPCGLPSRSSALHKLHTIFCRIYFGTFYFTPPKRTKPHNYWERKKKKKNSFFSVGNIYC
jgi:hypothetical protein